MKISVGDGQQYNVKFKYVNGVSEREITICSIRDVNTGVFYEASVKKHTKDKDNKRLARTLALGKALRAVTNDKKVRSLFWNQYNLITNDLPSVVVKSS